MYLQGPLSVPEVSLHVIAELAVIRLSLDVHRLEDLQLVENLYSAMWSIKRALQRDARAAVDAHWAGDVRRETDTKASRQVLGLSREGMERRGYRHMEGSKHLGHHVTKALVMHQADEVREGISRHLFRDTSGRRFGRPKTGTNAPPAASSPTATWSPVPSPHTSGSPIQTTPVPRAWTKVRPA
ncbi:hypothetical protein MBT84_01395 [Streptomyces sp. MBT84]|nr:hypothetical protein [Streptomyces sp. MBT84]